ncbi:hypothetical protein, partial [Fulvivirga imtechensis]|uniref:hypothetical protein n=1 Tax=Fulvivirga imtechensis TaxID=881893 RepID=UPI0012F83228
MEPILSHLSRSKRLIATSFLLISNVLTASLTHTLAIPDIAAPNHEIPARTKSSVEPTTEAKMSGMEHISYKSASLPFNTIWYEDFDNLPHGTNYHAGQAGWDGEASGVSGHFKVANQAYESNNLDIEAIWKSEVINIKYYTNIGIRVDLSSTGALESHEDYIKVYYRLDGGPETLLDNGAQYGSFGQATATVTGLAGEKLQIIIKVYNDHSAEYIVFDDVIVTGDAGNLPANLVWNETFNGLPDFSTSSGLWVRDVSGASIGSVGYFEVRQDRFLGRQLNGEAKLISESIDISNYSSVDMSVDLSGYGKMESSDYIKAYYRLDGGNEVLIGGFTGASAAPVTVSVNDISGNTVQFIIKVSNSSENERHVIDNMIVIGKPTLEIIEITGGTLNCTNPEVTISITTNSSNVDYLWEGPNGFSSTYRNPTVNVPGTYTVTVTDPTSGQSNSAGVEVSGGGSGVFWREDFTHPDGTDSDEGSTSWSIENSGGGKFEVLGNEFVVVNTGAGEVARWTSRVIDISGRPDVTISMLARSAVINGGNGLEDSGNLNDYLRLYYRLDGGSKTLVHEFSGEINGNNSEATRITSGKLNGSTLQVIIKGRTTAPDELYYFDNVELNSVVTATASASEYLSCTNTSVTLSGGSNTAGATFNWAGPGGFTSSSQNPVVTEPGMYTLTVTAPGTECTAVAEVEVLKFNTIALWSEDFTLPDGTDSDGGSTSWSIENSGGGNFEVSGNEFVIVNTGAGKVAKWTSEVIDISNMPNVTVTMAARSEVINGGNGLESSGNLNDYLRLYYILDGGSKILAHEFLGEINNNGHASIITSGELNGSTLQVVIKGRTTAMDELYYFDNVMVNAPLTATATVDGSLSCNNSSATISGSSNASNVTYNWTGPGGFTGNTQVISVSTPGDYTLEVSTPGGCTATAIAQVTSDGGGINTVWQENFTLADGTNSDNGPTSWTVQNSGSGTFSVKGNEFKASFNSANEGVWLSDVIDISGISNATVSADLRSATASSNDYFESDDYIRVYYKLNGGAETLIFGNNGGLNGANNAASSTTIESEPLNGSTVQIIFRVRNSHSTEKYYFDNVTVAGTSQGSVDAIVTVDGTLTCSNTSVDITGASSEPGVTYNWTGPEGFTADTQVITVSTPGDYTLVVSSSGGCTGTATATVTQDVAIPDISISPADTLSCAHTAVELVASSTTPNITISWDGFTPGESSITISESGTYIAQVINNDNGCTKQDTVTVMQDISLPQDVAASNTGPLTCLTTSVDLIGSTTTEGVTYRWLSSGSVIATTATVTVSAAGEYTLEVTKESTGCTTTVTTEVITDNTQPEEVTASNTGPLTCLTTSLELIGSTTTEGVTYRWLNSGSVIATTATTTVSAA